MPDQIVKVGPKGWSHGYVWHGPGPMPADAPPQAKDMSGHSRNADGRPATSGKAPAGHAPVKPGGKAPARPDTKPAKAKPAAGPVIAPGGTGSAEAHTEARALREQATGLREQARQLDHEAADLVAGERRAAGTGPKITNRTKPRAQTIPGKTPAKPAKPATSTAQRVLNLRVRATGLRQRATTLEQRATALLKPVNKSETSPHRRHVATTTTDELTYVSFPIEKFEKTDDGDLIVIGKATDGSVDSDDQIVSSAWSAKALERWMDTGGNVRVQHQAMRDPAGKGLSIDIDRDGDGGHWVRSLVVEPVAKRLVEKGILTAYSVGIARPVITRDPTGKARGGIVTGGELAEISLVDRPANKNCGLMIAKSAAGSADGMELVGELFGDPEFLAKASTENELLTKDMGAAATAVRPADGTPGGDDDGEDTTKPPAADLDTTPDDVDEEGDSAISKAVAPEVAAEYKAARKEWLAAEPSVKGVASTGTEYLAKQSDWRRWHANGEADGLDGTAEGAARWLAKRDFSQSERDQAADSGAAMPDGSFPIKSREDLGNAIHLAGNAKDPAAARAHIKRRAAAIGASDAIPDTWKAAVAGATPTEGEEDTAVKGAAADGTVGDSGSSFGGGGMKDCPTCKGDGKIMGNQRDCPDCGGKGKVPMGKSDDAPEVVKGSKDCAGCGKSYDADTSFNFCQNCGKKLPTADSARKAAKRAAKAAQVAELAATVAKSVEAGLLTQESADEIIALAAVEAGKAKRPLPTDVAGASMHREPDGHAVEDLEHQSGMATDPDGSYGDAPGDDPGMQVMAGKGEAPPYTVGRMHDVLCAAYDPGEAMGLYPALKSQADAADTEWLTGLAKSALDAGEARSASRLTGLLADAQQLKAADPAAVADAAAHLHKSFSDMYPTEHISPSDPPRPGSYQRPYLTGGHAAENAEHNGGPNIPPTSHTPEPEDFHRPLITVGHEADSPANKDMGGDVRNNAPVRTGAARTFYSNAQREAARLAMQNLHDHVAAAFPDLCPMAGNRAVMPPDNGAGNVPRIAKPTSQGGVPGVGKADPGAPAAHAGPDLETMISGAVERYQSRLGTPLLSRKQLAKMAAAAGYTLSKSTTAPEAPTAAPAVGLAADELRALLAEQIAPLAERYDTTIAGLQKQVDEIGSQPDPALAPVRGALAKAALTDPATPVERRSLVDEAAANTRKKATAEDTRYREYITALVKSPDPGVREAAMDVLDKMAAPAAGA